MEISKEDLEMLELLNLVIKHFETEEILTKKTFNNMALYNHIKNTNN